MELFSLQGKNALLTGATHGLGMAMAKALGQAGAQLLINGHTPGKLERAIAGYKKEGLSARGYLFDVTDQGAVEENIARAEKECGPVDILVNNAAIIRRGTFTELSLADWEAVIRTDLTGPFIVGQAVARGMKERRSGKIINICSMMSELGRDTVGAYAAAKGGLKMLTRNMATELARYNVQVNGIGPGYFATSQTKPLWSGQTPFNDFIENRTPAGRWGKPEDLGGTAVFLASAASDFVNGQIVYVDGGILATLGKPQGEK